MRADEILSAFVELQKGDTPVRGEFDLVDPRRNVRADDKLTASMELESAIRSAIAEPSF